MVLMEVKDKRGTQLPSLALNSASNQEQKIIMLNQRSERTG